jgi:CO/xanthine dehydrogenase FAD-binding subunit
MSLWKNYYLAQTIDEALSRISNGAKVIAGGTDLLLEIQHGMHPPVDNLVDVCNIPELNALEIRGNDLFIGAAVPLSGIMSSPLVIKNGQALVEACSEIGGPQVRNTATLGGNVAHALPAADGAVALLALGAQAESIDLKGRQISDLEDIFLGPRKSIITERKVLLVGFYFQKLGNDQASAFRRVMLPEGVALPVINISIWMHRSKNKILNARIALGTSGPVPIRANQAEKIVQGEIFSPGLIDKAYHFIIEELILRTSPYRSATDYRSPMAKVLLQEVFELAWQRSDNPGTVD